eukprot:TRINITY_DN1737_c0_g1_i3.p1 TRINITY_DN1737_c0_g1~~TRINITY_DN1737_c0_g1_i3.p1  ORF type:complete len:208 (+),score=83.57 TRINITY_DN1737_c0_g1_i3:217-840(+)
MTKDWMANNLIGVAFSVQGIQFLDLGSYQVSAMLLVGLFFYDIFWVFGTDVMVTVATKFDAPIKLVFPKNMLIAGAEWKHTLLGLGDIVIPGMFIALMLKLDHELAKRKALAGKKGDDTKEQEVKMTNFPTYYFTWAMIGYTVGMTTTIVVMHWFKAAQPALLYLVPTCLIFSLLPAMARGELMVLWNFSTQTEEEEKKEKEEKKEN